MADLLELRRQLSVRGSRAKHDYESTRLIQAASRRNWIVLIGYAVAIPLGIILASGVAYFLLNANAWSRLLSRDRRGAGHHKESTGPLR